MTAEDPTSIDLTEVAVWISGRISQESLVSRRSICREGGVEPLLGGTCVELAYRKGKVPSYNEECRRVGYRLVEALI